MKTDVLQLLLLLSQLVVLQVQAGEAGAEMADGRRQLKQLVVVCARRIGREEQGQWGLLGVRHRDLRWHTQQPVCLAENTQHNAPMHTCMQCVQLLHLHDAGRQLLQLVV